jgi:hypothetical protein
VQQTVGTNRGERPLKRWILIGDDADRPARSVWGRSRESHREHLSLRRRLVSLAKRTVRYAGSAYIWR